MPPSLSVLLSRWAASANGTAGRDVLRVSLIAAFHLVALGIMVATESAPEQKAAFILTWGVLNFFWLALLRRPGASAALSLAIVVLLIELSMLKYSVVWMTANFVDLMVIDQDTIAFLFTIFPVLGPIALAASAAGIPLLVLIWRLDPFRVRRATAVAGAAACIAGLTGLSTLAPVEGFEGFYGTSYVSHFARTGVDAISALAVQGYMLSDAAVTERLKAADKTCEPARRPPHIILVHDESSFDIRQAPGVKVPANYGSHFRSFDGVARKFVVEGTGGPSWYTEYNVLAGLSARSFGRFSYFVTRIASGRVERGLPHALAHCGYHTFSLYPWHGAFMSAASFQKTTGIEHFYDARALGASGLEPDRFYYDAAAGVIARERDKGPVFVFVYLAANHFPWDHRWRPDLMPQWKDLGNQPVVDEYLRRQTIGMRDYADFLARLKEDFPGEQFLIVRYGDHQPDFASLLLEPSLDEGAIAKHIAAQDPRYFTTYYAIDTINFRPVKTTSALEMVEGPYLPLVVQEAAGLPLDASFTEQKKILARCAGLFYGCAGGSEARRFNRMLIEAGLIKGL